MPHATKQTEQTDQQLTDERSSVIVALGSKHDAQTSWRHNGRNPAPSQHTPRRTDHKNASKSGGVGHGEAGYHIACTSTMQIHGALLKQEERSFCPPTCNWSLGKPARGDHARKTSFVAFKSFLVAGRKWRLVMYRTRGGGLSEVA